MKILGSELFQEVLTEEQEVSYGIGYIVNADGSFGGTYNVLRELLRNSGTIGLSDCN